MGDQSFRALVISLAVHAALAFVLSRLPSHYETDFQDAPIEISVVESEARGRKTHIEETRQPDLSPVEKLRKEADLLAALTKRVKEQTIARFGNTTRNRAGNLPTEADEMRARGEEGAGADAKLRSGQEGDGPGPGERIMRGSPAFGREVIVGESTANDVIKGLKLGSFTAVNTDRFVYYTYFNRINSQIRQRWVRNLDRYFSSLPQNELVEMASRDRVSEFDVMLDAEGRLLKILLLKSSGFPELDSAFTRAIEDAVPFPNAPRGMIEDDGAIHLRYIVTIIAQPFRVIGGR